jgi:two-component system nitrate/nitrite response regulator NarL
MPNTTILIVDDHQIVREGVRSLLATLRPGWSVSEAEDGIRALDLAQTQNPDVIIMDVTMPGLSGFDITSNLRKKGFQRPILLFTMHKSDQLANESHLAGAQGYVLKSQAVADLVRAIDILLAGGTFFGSADAELADRPNPSRNEPNPGTLLRLGLAFASAF